jgi:DNA-binding phage protein
VCYCRAVAEKVTEGKMIKKIDKSGSKNPVANLSELQIENAIRNLRIAVALSDQSGTTISKAAGLSQNVLGKFMRRESSITLPNIIAVCNVLKIPLGLVISAEQITPARIRLHNAVSKLSDEQATQVLESLGGLSAPGQA